MYGVRRVGWLGYQRIMLLEVLRMRKGVIKKIEVEKEWDATSSIIPASVLRSRTEGATDRCMKYSSDEEPVRLSGSANVEISSAGIVYI